MKLSLKQAVCIYKCLRFHCENIWHPNSFSFIRNCRYFMASASNSNFDNENEKPFLPKKALILTKFSRYEFEKRRHADLSEEELIKNVNHFIYSLSLWSFVNIRLQLQFTENLRC